MSEQQQLLATQNSGKFLEVWGLVGISILAFLSFALVRRKNYVEMGYHQTQLHGPGQHFLGAYFNLFKLSDKTTLLKQLEQWSILYGPIFEVNFGSLAITFLNSPNLVQKLFGNSQATTDDLFRNESQLLVRYLKAFSEENQNFVRLMENKPNEMQLTIFNSSPSNRNESLFMRFLQTSKEAFLTRNLTPFIFQHPIWDLCNSMSKVKEDAFRIGKLLAEACTLNPDDETQEEVAKEGLIHLSSGFESTAITLKFLLFLLALNPHHQETCHEEALENFPHVENEMNLDSLKNLKYLKMCIYETLRLFPPVPIFMTKIVKPLELDTNLSLPANSIVAVPIQGIHKNPKYFQNPEQFIPERFSDKKSITAITAYLSFSFEIKKCIGYKMDVLEIMNCASNIVRDYVISTPDKLEDIVLLPNVTITTQKAVQLIFHKRE